MSRSKYRFRKVKRYLMSLSGGQDNSNMASRVGSEASSAMSASEGATSVDQRNALSFLPVGAAVSAKYRGAFCEATIDRISKNFRVRVHLKNKNAQVTVEKADVLSGKIEANSDVSVLVKTGEYASPNPQNATIIRVTDLSLYTVVFDDGDTRSLKRGQLVLKGKPHFKESESLNAHPMTNPEKFKNPVIHRNRRYQSSVDDDDDEEGAGEGLTDIVEEEEGETRSEDDDEEEEGESTVAGRRAVSSSSKRRPAGGSQRRHSSTATTAAAVGPSGSGEDDPEAETAEEELSDEYRRLLGSLVMVDMPIPSKNDTSLLSTSFSGDTSINSTGGTTRRRYGPALVVLPSAMPSVDLKSIPTATTGKELVVLVKTYRENRFIGVPRSCLEVLERANVLKLSRRNPNLKNAFEKAVLWLDRREVPSAWGSLDTLLGQNWRSPASSYVDEVGSRRRGEAGGSSKKTKSSPSAGRRRRRRHRSPSPSSSSDDSSKFSRSPSSGEEEEDTSPRKGRTTATATTSTTKKKAPPSSKVPKSSHKSPSTSSTTHEEEGKESGDTDSSAGSGSGSRDEDSMDSNSPEYFEQRDAWIARFYGFMDGRGTPVNKAPSIFNKDLDLFKLNRIVDRHGGFHRVTANMKWPAVYSEMGLPEGSAAGFTHLQKAYKKYLYPVEEINRKLGTKRTDVPLALPRKSASKALKPEEKKKESGRRSGPSRETPVTKTKTRKPSPASSTAKSASGRLSGPKTTSRKSTDSDATRRDKKPATPSPSVKSSPVHSIFEHDDEEVEQVKDEVYQSPTGESSLGLTAPAAAAAATTTTTSTDVATASAVTDAATGCRSWPGAHGSSNGPIPLGTRMKVLYNGDYFDAIITKQIPRDMLVRRTSSEEPQTHPSRKGQTSEWLYKVHYIGWNKRHDEVVGLDRIQLTDAPKRSPSLNALDLTGTQPNGASSYAEEAATASDTGIRHQETTASKPAPSKKSSAGGKRSSEGGESDTRPPSASALVAPKKPALEALSEQARPPLKRAPSSVGSTASALATAASGGEQPMKKRRLQQQVDSSRPSGGGKAPAVTGKVVDDTPPGSPNSSIVDAATSLVQSPKLLKRVLNRVESVTEAISDDEMRGSEELATSTPMKHHHHQSPLPMTAASASKLGLEDISSDEDAFPSASSQQPRRQESQTKAAVKLEASSTSKTAGKYHKNPQLPPQPSSSAAGDKTTTTVRKTSAAPKKPANKIIKAEAMEVQAEATTTMPSPATTSKPSISKTRSSEESAAAVRDSSKGATRKTSGKTKPKAQRTPEASISSSTASSSRSSASSLGRRSSDSGGASDEESDDGARDVLPRLTRSQHRLIFTDAPPSATLPTALPTLKREAEESDHHPTTTSKVSGKKTAALSKKAAPAKTVNESGKPMEENEKEEGEDESAVPAPPSPAGTEATLPMTGEDGEWTLEDVEMPEKPLSDRDDEEEGEEEDVSSRGVESKSPRGGVGGGTRGVSRGGRRGSTAGEGKNDDEAESVVSSSSSGLRNGKRAGRGRRGTGSAGAGVASSSLQVSSPPAPAPTSSSGISSPSTTQTVVAATPTSPAGEYDDLLPVYPFGGPFLPIPDIEELPLNIRANIYERRLNEILVAYRKAVTMLQELDERAARRDAAVAAGGGDSSEQGGGGRGGRRGGFRGGPRRRQSSNHPSDDIQEQIPCAMATTVDTE